MLKRSLVVLGLLAVVGLIVTFPGVIQAQQNGSENFIFVNYIGQEIILDLDDVTYVVPGTSTAPEGGRLALNLAAGEHKFAANAPGVPTGAGGEFTIVPGSVVAKAVRLEKTPVKVQDGIVIAEPEDYVYVFDFDPFAAPVEDTPLVDTWQPTAALPGQGSLVFTNYYGGDELTVDLEGQLYKVPPQSEGIPGRLQIDLLPGLYRFTVSLPNGSLNSEVQVIAGQITGLNISTDVPEPIEYDVGDEYEPLPSITLNLAEEDLTGQVGAGQVDEAAGEAPATLPTTGGEPLWAPETSEGLWIKNYAGDTMVFTINNQTFTIANNTEQKLNLPPGQYSYTASLPFVATTGIVEVMTGHGLELSIVLDVNQNILNTYQN